MDRGLAGMEVSSLPELFHEEGVGILDEHPAHHRDLIRELPRVIHGSEHGEAVALPRRVVVGPECGSHMYDSRALLGTDEILQDHGPAIPGIFG